MATVANRNRGECGTAHSPRRPTLPRRGGAAADARPSGHAAGRVQFTRARTRQPSGVPAAARRTRERAPCASAVRVRERERRSGARNAGLANDGDAVSTLSIDHRRVRCRKARCRRARGVSTSKIVLGPTTTGNAAVSSRTPTTSVIGTRRAFQVSSRGRPSNQSARTCTCTGSTRTMATNGLLSGGGSRLVAPSAGHRVEQNGCSIWLGA